MNKSILYKLSVNIIKCFKPIIRFIAEKSDIALLTPRMANGQNPLIFNDNDITLQNNIPKSVYFNTRSRNISIGSNTVFEEFVMVLTGQHNFISNIDKIEDIHQVPNSGRDIEIGENCYIGSGAIIIGPVKIGNFAVIAVASVVTKDIKSYTMVGGVPVKMIKKLTNQK